MTDEHTQNAQPAPPPQAMPPVHREAPLTDEEIREVREMLEADRRVKWLWAGARKVAIWVAAVVGALVVSSEFIVKVIKNIAGS